MLVSMVERCDDTIIMKLPKPSSHKKNYISHPHIILKKQKQIWTCKLQRIYVLPSCRCMCCYFATLIHTSYQRMCKHSN